MRILKLIFGVIVALILLVFIALFVFIKAFDVNKYLPQISHQISASINRKVTIGEGRLNWDFKGLSVDLDNVIVVDDPKFSPNYFLSIDNAHLNVDVMALIEKRQLDVTEIVLKAPKIGIVRLANGEVNVQTMVPAQPSTNASGGVQSAPNSKAASSSDAALPVIFIKSIIIRDAQLSFEDQNPQMPLHFIISDAQVSIDDFSLTKPFGFTASLNAWGQKQDNFNISGYCSLDLAKTAAHITDIAVKTDLSQWDWAKLRTVTPSLENLPVWIKMDKGDLSLNIPEINASAQGLEALTFDLQGRLGEGEINAKGAFHVLQNSPQYDLQVDLKSVHLDDVLDQIALPVIIKGQADLSFTGTGEGFDPQRMLQNLKGQGQFDLHDGQIDKLNILKTILDKINFLPGNVLQTAAEGYLPADIKSQLDTDTTKLDKAEVKIKLGDKKITVQDAQIQSQLFSIVSQGTVDFDLNTQMNVKTYLSEEISRVLTKAARPLQALVDDQNRIYIPGKISGKAPAVHYQPQSDYLTKKVAADEAGQQLQKVFKKNPAVGNLINAVLGGGQQGQQTSTSGNDSDNSSSQKLINGLLNKIL